jgi:RraA family protein
MTNDTGFRAFSKINRPSPDLIELFRNIPVATIADNMNRLFCLDSTIRPINKKHILGPAFTVKVPAGDNLMIHKAISMAEPGDVIVVDAGGNTQRSLVGQIMSTYAMSRGIAGFIIDGAIRDFQGLSTMDFPVYARAITPQGPYKNGPGEINVPVAIGGQVILPGDIIVGDLDGVVIISPDDAREVAACALARFEMETKILLDIAAGLWTNKWLDKTCTDLGLCQIDD